MIDAEIMELIQKEADGLTTPEEAERLRIALGRDLEARRYHEETRRLVGMLRQVKPLDPPESLRAAVMGSVPVREERGVLRRTQGALERLIGPDRRWRYAASFTLGLAVGLITLVLYLGSYRSLFQTGGSGAEGTLLPGLPRVGLRQVDQRDFQGEGIRGSAALRTGPSLVILDLELQAGEAGEAVIEYDPEILSPRGYSQERTGRGEVLTTVNEIRIGQVGTNTFHLVFARMEGARAEIRLHLVSSGVPLHIDLRSSE